MDEAFSALDPLIRTEMQDELLKLQASQQRTIVFISHDLDEAMRIGDRIAIMQDGQLVQVGTPDEILNQPANDYVRAFFRGVDLAMCSAPAMWPAASRCPSSRNTPPTGRATPCASSRSWSGSSATWWIAAAASSGSSRWSRSVRRSGPKAAWSRRCWRTSSPSWRTPPSMN
jgi:ABC-type proline/glycine betaine transport system ATPase subunit